MNYRGGPWTTIFNKATIPYCEFNNFLKFSYKANLFKFSVLLFYWQGQIQNKKSMDQNSLYSKLKK